MHRPEEPEAKTLTAFRLPPPTLRRLDALGVAAGMTRSQVIRLAVDAVIEVGEGEKSNDQQRTG